MRQASNFFEVSGYRPNSAWSRLFLGRVFVLSTDFRASGDFWLYLSGSFFERYPRHGKLISINKRFTGKTNKEFNMRHDWNSLLSDNESLLMKYYSKDFFPNKDSLKDYLNDFANSFKLNIQYNTNVSNIHKVWNDSLDSNIYHMVDQSGNTYQCR